MAAVPNPHVRIDQHGFAYVEHPQRKAKIFVHRLWKWHRTGVAVHTLVKRYSLPWQIVLDALSYAYDHTAEVEAMAQRSEEIVEAAVAAAPKQLFIPGFSL